MTSVNVLKPFDYHSARCVPVDKYSNTKAFKEATLGKEKLRQINQKYPTHEQIEIIQELAVESLIGFIGFIHILKKKTANHSPESLEVSIRFIPQERLSEGKYTYMGIQLLNGIDMDSMEVFYISSDEQMNYPWIRFYPAHRNIRPGEDGGRNETRRNLYKPVVLKNIKQE